LEFYLGQAIAALKEIEYKVDDNLPQYLSPLGWKHINLIGAYFWQQKILVKQGKFRLLQQIT
jgi:hypothetical protein